MGSKRLHSEHRIVRDPLPSGSKVKMIGDPQQGQCPVLLSVPTYSYSDCTPRESIPNATWGIVIYANRLEQLRVVALVLSL
jgi:hypothetical protein